MPQNNYIPTENQENNDTLEGKKHEIRRSANLIKGRVDSLMEKLDKVDPEMLQLVEQMIENANNSFDKVASSDEW